MQLIWLQRVGKGILQEKVYKTRITDLNEIEQRLRTELVTRDHVVIVAASRQWRRLLIGPVSKFAHVQFT